MANRGKRAVPEILQVGLHILLIYGLALGINYLWEMLQMPFYVGMYFSDPASYLICLKASFGDANISIGIYLVGSLIFREWRWPDKPSSAKLAYLATAGGITAVAIELLALNAGRWKYSASMPLLPILNVGVIPFLQLLILPYLSYLIAGRIHYFGNAKSASS